MGDPRQIISPERKKQTIEFPGVPAAIHAPRPKSFCSHPDCLARRSVRRSGDREGRGEKRGRDSELVPDLPVVDAEEQQRLLEALQGGSDAEDRLIEERRRRRQVPICYPGRVRLCVSRVSRMISPGRNKLEQRCTHYHEGYIVAGRAAARPLLLGSCARTKRASCGLRPTAACLLHQTQAINARRASRWYRLIMTVCGTQSQSLIHYETQVH